MGRPAGRSRRGGLPRMAVPRGQGTEAGGPGRADAREAARQAAESRRSGTAAGPAAPARR